MPEQELSGRLVTGESVRLRHDHGRITELVPLHGTHDLPWLLPGLVDLQVNGWAGLDVNDPDVDPDQIVALSRALAEQGTTTWVPTVVTAAPEGIDRAIRAVVRARESDSRTRAAIPFLHLEGPWISAQDGPRGVHPATQVREPDLAEYERYRDLAGGLLGLITLSPHTESAPQIIRAMVADGVRVSIGHTHADPDQIRVAADAGATLSTHLGNGAHAQLPRHPNYLWAQLAEDRLTACFIADGHHLPLDTLRVMLRAKGIGCSILVSDSVALGGLAPGEYQTPVGGRVILEDGGRLREAGSSFLAGAAAPLLAGLLHCVKHVTDLPTAVRLSAVNPGSWAGGRGVLGVGEPADALVLDEDLVLRRVLVAGTELDAP